MLFKRNMAIHAVDSLLGVQQPNLISDTQYDAAGGRTERAGNFVYQGQEVMMDIIETGAEPPTSVHMQKAVD